ncbi:MAG TPA: glycosyltransferase [Gemmatimonadaceae bacterium]
MISPASRGLPTPPAEATRSSPLVSVVFPVYNGGRYLREALDSVLAQTYRPMEVIVMDDASTDDTPAILATYGDAIRVVRQSQNQGIYPNTNAGIRLARGELIASYHSDDVYLPTIVEQEVAFLERYPEVGAVFASDIFIDAEGREYGRLALPPDVPADRPLDFRLILNGLLTHKNKFLRCPTAMVRASVYRDVGVYRADEFSVIADEEMWLRIARRYPIGILSEHLLRYRHFHGNATQAYHHLRTEPNIHFRILDEYVATSEGETTPEALAAHEAHRAEDRLMIVVNHYIAGARGPGREALRRVRLRSLVGSPAVQRVRLLILWAALQLLCRLPHIGAVARAFYRRWHVKRSPWTEATGR